jgi:hypothetical protein
VEDLEQFLAGFRVVGQRPIGKSEVVASAAIAYAIDDAAAVQRPEAKVADEHCHDGSRLSRGVPGEQLDPSEFELSPRNQCRTSAFEGWPAVADGRERLVNPSPV